MRNHLIETFQNKLHVFFDDIAKMLSHHEVNVSYKVYDSRGTAFEHNLSLAFIRDKVAGNELVINTIIKKSDIGYVMSGDICNDGGVVLADIGDCLSTEISEIELDAFYQRIRKFLDGEIELIKAHISMI